MLRLLQGDVGSGKTLVALLAMLRAVEAGKQAALMAPTEVLAKQHHRTLSRLMPRTGRPADRLDQRQGAGASAARHQGRQRCRSIVGTHALFQDAVEYRDLALAVIDEQHRFGVNQRLTLGAKGERTDVLIMTATPIPRTLLLTQWGEMDVSRLTEKARRAAADPHHAAFSGHDAHCTGRHVARKLDEGARRSIGSARWWPRVRRWMSPPPKNASSI